MARAIIRCSFGADDRDVRGRIRDEGRRAGFREIGRKQAAFEGRGASRDLIGALTAAPRMAEGGTQGHVLISLDQPKKP
jgi:hypothetical protein